LQTIRLNVLIAITGSFILAGCAASLPSAGVAGPGNSAGPTSAGQRELGPEEKKVIMAAVALSLRDPAAARYHWARFPAAPSGDSINYCATVDAKSPFPAYDGHQAYIVETRLSGGRVVSATMGLIAGGKDVRLVAKMCAKYDLDPAKTS